MSKKGLTRERILEAAIGIIDRDGIDGLSMRALGRECEVEAMSLYRYVANKDELLDAVQGAIVAQLQLGSNRRPWKATLDAAARAFRRVLAAHPKAIPLFVRPAASQVALAALEHVWQVLVKAGFSELDALRGYQSLLAFVVGQALWQFTPEGERPVDDEFEFGLELMLLGLDRKLALQRRAKLA